MNNVKIMLIICCLFLFPKYLYADKEKDILYEIKNILSDSQKILSEAKEEINEAQGLLEKIREAINSNRGHFIYGYYLPRGYYVYSFGEVFIIKNGKIIKQIK